MLADVDLFVLVKFVIMQLFGGLASLLIGISLGMIGGGGSILTVPVLVYLFAINPVLSTSYSLFIVGSTSLVGAYNNYRKGLVRIKTALLFGLSSVATVFLTRKLLIPVLPEYFGSVGNFKITQSLLIMVLFAVLMVAASISMIKGGQKTVESDGAPMKKINIAKLSVLYRLFSGVFSTAKTIKLSDKSTCLRVVKTPWVAELAPLLGSGLGIGFVTGLLGAGGGFLLVPTLVLIVKLPMKEAVGTSLFIIALNSLIGFTGDLGHFAIDWIFLLQITSIAIVGIFIGGAFNKKIKGDHLKKGFGWFVLIMGIYIVAHEILVK